MKSLAARFEEKYIPVPESGCWLWLGATNQRGYGQFFWGGKLRVSAHRAGYAMEHGSLPPSDVHVLHRCDTPSCVNPHHLFLGDQQVNMADMRAKGRGYAPPTLEFCARGHPIKPRKSGRRYCKTCNHMTNLRAQGRFVLLEDIQ